MQVLNLDPVLPTTLTADLYHQGGGDPVSVTWPSVAPGGAAQFWFPAPPRLADGRHALVTSSDRAIGTLVSTQWSHSGGAVVTNDSPAGTDVIVPFLSKGFEGQSSYVTIQNTDTDAPASATITLFSAGQAAALATVELAIGSGTSVTLDMVRDLRFQAMPMGTVGYARIRSITPIAVQSIVDIEDSQKAVYAFEGLPAVWLPENSTRL